MFFTKSKDLKQFVTALQVLTVAALVALTLVDVERDLGDGELWLSRAVPVVMAVGAVAAIRDFANPVSIARRLSKEPVNNLLVGEGAEKYAHKEGFERKNMLTDRAKIHYRNRKKEIAQTEIKPYAGHDTVGMVCLDAHGKMTSATSTSGLFMKRKGRVGDSPISGSGFYVDSKVGGASATGLGEDVMKGCVSYEIVRLMREGMHPQEACEKAVAMFDRELKERRGKAGDMSLIAMNNKGEWGVATNIECT